MFTLLNLTGQIEYEITQSLDIGLNKAKLNLSGFEKGLYFYTVRVNGKKSLTRKLILK